MALTVLPNEAGRLNNSIFYEKIDFNSTTEGPDEISVDHSTTHFILLKRKTCFSSKSVNRKPDQRIHSSGSLKTYILNNHFSLDPYMT